jgi:hypothetical protein
MRSQQSASGSSAQDRLKAAQWTNNTPQALCAPSSDQAPYRSGGPLADTIRRALNRSKLPISARQGRRLAKFLEARGHAASLRACMIASGGQTSSSHVHRARPGAQNCEQTAVPAGDPSKGRGAGSGKRNAQDFRARRRSNVNGRRFEKILTNVAPAQEALKACPLGPQKADGFPTHCEPPLWGQSATLAVDYSITSSAMASILSGIWTSSVLAVLRLRTRSNLIGCSIGISPGFAPFRILST